MQENKHTEHEIKQNSSMVKARVEVYPHPRTRGRTHEWCAKCSAVLKQKHWVADPALHAEYEQNPRGKTLCPKHEMSRLHRFEGIVLLHAVAAVKNRQDLLNLIQNLGEASERQDSQDAILMEEISNDEIRIEVSDDQLATRFLEQKNRSNAQRAKIS